MRDTDSELLHALGKVVLVVVLRDHNLWRSRSRRGGRGAGATVVNDSGHSLEQRLLVDLVDR